MFLSTKPWLYTTTMDHLTDLVTWRASVAGVNVDGLEVLASMGNYANGVAIAATIGSRASVSRTKIT
jgi:hypothetical protein